MILYKDKKKVQNQFTKFAIYFLLIQDFNKWTIHPITSSFQQWENNLLAKIS